MQQLNTNKQTTKCELVHRQRLYFSSVLRKIIAKWRKKQSWNAAVEVHSFCHWKLDRQITYDWQISSSFLFQSTDIEGQEKQAEMSLFVYIDFRYRLCHRMRCFFWCTPWNCQPISNLSSKILLFLSGVEILGHVPLQRNEKRSLGYPCHCGNLFIFFRSLIFCLLR